MDCCWQTIGDELLFTASADASSTSSAGKLVTINYSDAFLTAEIYWLAKMANCNYSLRSVDHIGDAFKKMFPDSKIETIKIQLE